MSQLFEIRNGTSLVGTFSGGVIKQMAADGRVNGGMQIRRLPDGPWSPLSSVKGLAFKASPTPAAAAIAPQTVPSLVPPPLPSAPDDDAPSVNLLSQIVPLAPPTTVGSGDIECPFCSEPIKATAKKCKHCGEFLNHGASASSQDAVADKRECPSCGEQIKAMAKKCPFCGDMLAPTQSAAPTDDSDRSGLDAARRSLVRTAICYLVFTGIWVVCYAILDSMKIYGLGPRFGGATRGICVWIMVLSFFGQVITWIYGAIACYRVAAKVYDPGLAVLLAVVTLLFAWFGCVILLAVNAKAVSVLRRSGALGRS